ncbi:hypothetical protein M2128_002217 [Polynucleobacter sphagniphilus]|uniref:glycine zipper family protein n=1 Tax=Polynucleobacter sphagniphilus TaxID=1743169 RepID=UPI00247506AA|nr:glycine zipper family protein [Polynucleobacter sphagniphilus]MDH6303271.1 hypothetical protein [Polynucleobacter sphagniphilus]
MRNTVYAVTAVLAVAIAGPAFSKPVEFDTPDVHVLITRPLDGLNQNDSAMWDKVVSSYNQKQYAYVLQGLTSAESEKINSEIIVLASKQGFSENADKKTRQPFIFKPPVLMSGAEVNTYISNQNKVWTYKSLELSKEEDLIAKAPAAPSSSDGSVPGAIGEGLFGGLIGAGVGSAIGKAVGGSFGAVLANGGGAVIGAETGVTIGASGSPAKAPESNSPALETAPDAEVAELLKDQLYGFNPVPVHDYSKYKKVDVIKVQTSIKNTGVILIAYKKTKTQPVFQAALGKALISAMSIDEPKDERIASAEKNQKDRASLFDSCVSLGRCQ